MLAGRLLSDEEMIQIMDKILDVIDTNQEFILDRFPAHNSLKPIGCLTG